MQKAHIYKFLNQGKGVGRRTGKVIQKKRNVNNGVDNFDDYLSASDAEQSLSVTTAEAKENLSSLSNLSLANDKTDKNGSAGNEALTHEMNSEVPQNGKRYNLLTRNSKFGRRTGKVIEKKRNVNNGVENFDDYLSSSDVEKTLNVTDALPLKSRPSLGNVSSHSIDDGKAKASNLHPPEEVKNAGGSHMRKLKSSSQEPQDGKLAHLMARNPRYGRRTGKDLLAGKDHLNMENFSNYLSDGSLSETKSLNPTPPSMKSKSTVSRRSTASASSSSSDLSVKVKGNSNQGTNAITHSMNKDTEEGSDKEDPLVEFAPESKTSSRPTSSRSIIIEKGSPRKSTIYSSSTQDTESEAEDEEKSARKRRILKNSSLVAKAIRNSARLRRQSESLKLVEDENMQEQKVDPNDISRKEIDTTQENKALGKMSNHGSGGTESMHNESLSTGNVDATRSLKNKEDTVNDVSMSGKNHSNQQDFSGYKESKTGNMNNSNNMPNKKDTSSGIAPKSVEKTKLREENSALDTPKLSAKSTSQRSSIRLRGTNTSSVSVTTENTGGDQQKSVSDNEKFPPDALHRLSDRYGKSLDTIIIDENISTSVPQKTQEKEGSIVRARVCKRTLLQKYKFCHDDSATESTVSGDRSMETSCNGNKSVAKTSKAEKSRKKLEMDASIDHTVHEACEQEDVEQSLENPRKLSKHGPGGLKRSALPILIKSGNVSCTSKSADAKSTRAFLGKDSANVSVPDKRDLEYIAPIAASPESQEEHKASNKQPKEVSAPNTKQMREKRNAVNVESVPTRQTGSMSLSSNVSPNQAESQGDIDERSSHKNKAGTGRKLRKSEVSVSKRTTSSDTAEDSNSEVVFMSVSSKTPTNQAELQGESLKQPKSRGRPKKSETGKSDASNNHIIGDAGKEVCTSINDDNLAAISSTTDDYLGKERSSEQQTDSLVKVSCIQAKALGHHELRSLSSSKKGRDKNSRKRDMPISKQATNIDTAQDSDSETVFMSISTKKPIYHDVLQKDALKQSKRRGRPRKSEKRESLDAKNDQITGGPEKETCASNDAGNLNALTVDSATIAYDLQENQWSARQKPDPSVSSSNPKKRKISSVYESQNESDKESQLEKASESGVTKKNKSSNVQLKKYEIEQKNCSTSNLSKASVSSTQLQDTPKTGDRRKFRNSRRKMFTTPILEVVEDVALPAEYISDKKDQTKKIRLKTRAEPKQNARNVLKKSKSQKVKCQRGSKKIPQKVFSKRSVAKSKEAVSEEIKPPEIEENVRLSENNIPLENMKEIGTDETSGEENKASNAKKSLAASFDSVVPETALASVGLDEFDGQAEGGQICEVAVTYTEPLKSSSGKKKGKTGKRKSSIKPASPDGAAQSEQNMTLGSPVTLRLIDSLPSVTPQSGVSFRRSKHFTSMQEASGASPEGDEMSEVAVTYTAPLKSSSGNNKGKTGKRKSSIKSASRDGAAQSEQNTTLGSPVTLRLIDSLPSVTPQSGVSFRQSRQFTSAQEASGASPDPYKFELKRYKQPETDSTPVGRVSRDLNGLASCLRDSSVIRPLKKGRRVRISNVIATHEAEMQEKSLMTSEIDTTSLLSPSASPVHYAETTQSGGLNVDQPSFVLPDLSHFIVRPEHRDVSGLRRSSRTRVKPVAAYKGERVVYRRDSTGYGLIVDTIQPSIGEAKIKAYEEKRRKKLLKRKLKAMNVPAKPNKRLSTHVYNLSQDVTQADTLPAVHPETEEKVLIEMVSRRSDICWKGPELSPVLDTDPVAGCVQLQQPSFSSGEVQLRALAEKDYERTLQTLVYTMIHGKVFLTINEKSTIVETGDDFFVPRGSAYGIKNLRKDVARLHFVNLQDNL